MNDEEIKKALEEFQNRIVKTNLSYHIFESEMMAVVNALVFINQQQAEIERLQKTLDDVLDRQPLLVERAEKYAREELAERIKAELSFGKYITAKQIDEVLAEMVDGMNEKNNKI